MVRRDTLQETIISELRTATDGLVDPEHVTKQGNDRTVSPQVIFGDEYRIKRFNLAGDAPDSIVFSDEGFGTDFGNNFGTYSLVEKEIYREYFDGLITIQVRASNDATKLSVAEAIRRHFGKYRFGPWKPSNIHSDITHIHSGDIVNSDSLRERKPSREDTLDVQLTFFTEYEFSTGNIEEIYMEIEDEFEVTING